jgi:tRNA(Ile)-lysidine synthase TilS/MesJ
MPYYVDERIAKENFHLYHGFNNKYSIEEMNKITLRHYLGNLINYLKFDFKLLSEDTKHQLVEMIASTDFNIQELMKKIRHSNVERGMERTIYNILIKKLETGHEGFQDVVTFLGKIINGLRETSKNFSSNITIRLKDNDFYPHQSFTFSLKEIIPQKYFNKEIREQFVEEALSNFGKTRGLILLTL